MLLENVCKNLLSFKIDLFNYIALVICLQSGYQIQIILFNVICYFSRFSISASFDCVPLSQPREGKKTQFLNFCSTRCFPLQPYNRFSTGSIKPYSERLSFIPSTILGVLSSFAWSTRSGNQSFNLVLAIQLRWKAIYCFSLI